MLFLFSVLLTLASADNETCVTLVRQCVAGDSVLNGTQNGTSEPLVKPPSDDAMLSQLIRYNHSGITTITSKIPIDDTFIDHLALLHNNTKQLRILLAILRSDTAPAWMKAMSGYGVCGQEAAIYTCYADVCRAYDLTKLTYVNTIFTENVLGFELLPHFKFAVLLGARNEDSKMGRPIRIPIPKTGIGLFYAIWNVIKGFFTQNELQSPLIARLEKYYQDLDAEYKLLPKKNVLFFRSHGTQAVDAQTYTGQPAVIVKS
ncbi:envelope glycoprotein L [Saimiriine betaherpesvirus 4]|uniref:Envelope glycoprotein L n=1 Tax=Saimiriine betaherpesvirus 4 TaxID=1535247 RepID=G8XT12_9BETA|nr:envelope glycoprotein L [Saimiriine betaherpesvirus 4]AEV80958.1 envelope glycoprotein L [Saimiriine betaherpesvirus 4]